MASTTLQKPNEIENIPENVVKNANKPVDLTRQNQHENRKTLQTLQYSTGVPISPIRKIVKPQKKNLIQKVQRPITVFIDPPKKKLDDKASQTDKTRKNSVDVDDLVSDEVSETYWKELAEERRRALNESLHENEQLHKEVSELKDENEKLSKVASQAEYFADVLKDVLGAEDEDDAKEVLNGTDDDKNCDSTDRLPTDDLLLDKSDDKQEEKQSDSDDKHRSTEISQEKSKSEQSDESTSDQVL